MNAKGPAILGLLLLLFKKKKPTPAAPPQVSPVPAPVPAPSPAPPVDGPTIADQVNDVEDDGIKRQRIALGQKIQFAKAKSTILPESFAILDEVAEALAAAPLVRIAIEGHTSSEGSTAYNLKLSQARANSVRQYLIEHGIDPNRMVADGYGELVPLTSNETEAGREKNRRVEFFAGAD